MIMSKNKQTILLILIAFIFSFSVRLIWVYKFQDTAQFKFNNEFMINTNDGYFFAEGARDILAGGHQENDLSAFEQAASQLTAVIVKILPLPFETIIFYMPAFFSSLIVIPIILIGRELGKLEVGFIAALIASIAWSYYNRTMVGYFDTDLLNIVFPTILLWSLIWAVDTKEKKYLLFAAADIIAYRWWYPQSYALEFAFFGLILCYTGYVCYKERKNLKTIFNNKEIVYLFHLLIIMILAMVQIDIVYRIILVLLYFGFTFKEELNKYLPFILIGAFVLFLSTGGFEPIWVRLKLYIFKDSVTVSETGLGLHFYSVIQTVREAGKIPFETFANRISGHTITFIFAVLGYIWLAYRYRIMLLALPMMGLGFLALSGGLRFTIYAVPVAALGIAYLIYEISAFLSKQILNDTISKISYYILLLIFTTGALYPNIKHIQQYLVPTVFTAQEVKTLDKLKSIAKREDYVVSWWDYGYPLRYYSDVKTLVDGGKHSGEVNFPVSFILNAPQNLAAKMARLDVEYTEKRFHKGQNEKWAQSNIEQMTLDYGYKDTNKFLSSLNGNIKLPQKSRDIYIYLPHRMMNILPTVTLFSNINLMTGDKGKAPFFYQSQSFRDEGTRILLGQGVEIDKKTGQVKVGPNRFNINKFAVTTYDKKGQLQKQVQMIDRKAPLNVIFMKNYNKFLLLDNSTFNSLYIQLFVLENYNKDLFEPVILDPLSKVFKLKG